MMLKLVTSSVGVALTFGGAAALAETSAVVLANEIAARRNQYFYTAPTESSLRQGVARLRAEWERLAKTLDGGRREEAEDAYAIGELIDQMEVAEPDFDQLQLGYDKMRSELTEPIDFATADWKNFRTAYVNQLREVRAARETDRINALQRQLDSLVENLRAIGAARDATAQYLPFAKISESYRWLTRRNQLPELRQKIAHLFASPNQRLLVSEKFLRGAIHRSFSQSQPVSRQTNGVTVRGNGSGSGEVHAEVVANGNQAELRVVLSGSASATDLTATKGRNTVFLESHSTITGGMSLYFDKQLQLVRGAPSVDANTNTSVVGSHFTPRQLFKRRNPDRIRRGGVRENIAASIAQEKNAEVSAQTEAELEREILSNFNQDFFSKYKEEVSSLKELSKEKFRFPLDRVDLFPLLRLYSTENDIALDFTFAADEELTAPFGVPTDLVPYGAADVRGFVHESALNRFSISLKGKRIDEGDFRKLFLDKLGMRVPPEFDATGENPAALTFADDTPYVIQLGEGIAEVRLRLKAFKAEKKVYKSRVIEVRAGYTLGIDPKDGGVTLNRRGKVEVYDPETNEIDLESKEAVAFQGIADRFIVVAAKSQGVDLGKKPVDLGRFIASQIKVSRGWLGLGWNHVKGSKQ